jgi:hypothetical protein
MFQRFTGGGRGLLTHRRRCDLIVPINRIELQYDRLLQILAKTLRQCVAFPARKSLAMCGAKLCR